MTFAGLPLPEIREILSKMRLSVPRPQDSLMLSKYKTWLYRAKKYHPNYELTQDQLDEAGVDTSIFTWAQLRFEDPQNPHAAYVRKIFHESMDLRHRGMVDVLLFMKQKSLDDIALLLRRYCRASSVVWTESEIKFYRDNFFNTVELDTRNWTRYVLLAKSDAGALSHIHKLLSDNKQELLECVDLPPSLSPQEMVEDVINSNYSIYVQTVKEVKTSDSKLMDPNRRQALKVANDNYIRSVAAAKDSGSDASAIFQQLEATLNRLELDIGYNPAGAEVVPLESIQGSVSDNEGTEQCDFIIEAERDGFVHLDELDDPEESLDRFIASSKKRNAAESEDSET